MRCFHPRVVHCQSNGHSYEVPCGKCAACRKRKQSEWVFRMDMERKYGSRRNCFFCTLTYDESVLPYGVSDLDTGECEPVLCPSHCTDFWKRYRRYSGDDCRFFMCGEYGDTFDRPHLHFVIYTNLPWRECLAEVKHAWSYSVPNSTPLGYGVFERDGIYRTRRKLFGLVTLSSVNIRRMRYCAKYIVKDTNSSNLVPKFARVSRGLGKCFLTNSLEWLPCKQFLKTVVQTSDSKPVSLPRYFRDRLFTADEKMLIQMRHINDEFDLINSFRNDPDGYKAFCLDRWSQEDVQRQVITLSQFNFNHLYG